MEVGNLEVLRGVDYEEEAEGGEVRGEELVQVPPLHGEGDDEARVRD